MESNDSSRRGDNQSSGQGEYFKSVFLKWSGNGAHVHIHHKAFSPELLRKINPLDAAYAIVEYVNSKLRSRYLEIAKRHRAQELKVENEMDLQRVFTCP